MEASLSGLQLLKVTWLLRGSHSETKLIASHHNISGYGHDDREVIIMSLCLVLVHVT